MAAIVKESAESIYYSRCKFTTKLPRSHRYTAAHFWLAKEGKPDLWRVGFTKFAVRMLGEIVEMEMTVKAGEPVQVGQVIGKFEGFKAVTDLYSVMNGVFERVNPDLEKHGSWLRTDPYFKGWLYEVRGVPEPNAVDANGYIAVLNGTIDKMQE